jgi:hypothetical protein
MALPLGRRLTRMNMLVSGLALLLAGLAFASYDLLTFRGALLRNLSIQGRSTHCGPLPTSSVRTSTMHRDGRSRATGAASEWPCRTCRHRRRCSRSSPT